MIRINFVKPSLFLLLVIGFILLLINEVQALHCWHDRFYTQHSEQSPQIFDIASDTPLPVQTRPQQLANVAPRATHRTVW